jgi:hypothetical protein
MGGSAASPFNGEAPVGVVTTEQEPIDASFQPAAAT